MALSIRCAGVFVVWGVLLFLLQPSGAMEYAAVIASAIALEGVVLLTRRSNIWRIAAGTVGTFTGALIGIVWLAPAIKLYMYGSARVLEESAKSNLIGCILGAIAGSSVALLIARLTMVCRKSHSSSAVNRQVNMVARTAEKDETPNN